MEAAEKLNGSIERVLAFLNSRGVGYETGTDRFSSAEEASSFLASLLGSQSQLSSRAFGELKRLRQALLMLVASSWRDRVAADALNEISSRSPYTIAFPNEHETRLEPASEGSALGLILRDVAALIAAGQWTRVKNCSDEACASTFFDRSRNKTQRWHSFEICGNKNNVAAHRARQS